MKKKYILKNGLFNSPGSRIIFPIMLIAAMLFSPKPVYAAGQEILEEGQIFSTSVGCSPRHTSSSWQAASNYTTVGPYDLSSVKYMSTTATVSYSDGDWKQSVGASATWYDANGSAITQLSSSNSSNSTTNVQSLKNTYDLTSCTCTLYVSGYTRNLWQAASGYAHMGFSGVYSCTVTELVPKNPYFSGNLTVLYS